MRVRFYPYRGKGIGYGNVIWTDRRDAPGFRMRNGKFGPEHPCRDNPLPTVFSRAEQPATDDALGNLRARGYLASCFPEGDGIAFEPPDGISNEQAVQDFAECFGFEVEVVA